MRKREGDTTLVRYYSQVNIDHNLREYLFFFQSQTSVYVAWLRWFMSVEKKKVFWCAFSFFFTKNWGRGACTLIITMKEKTDRVIDDVAIGCDPIWQQTATSILLKSWSFIFSLVYIKERKKHSHSLFFIHSICFVDWMGASEKSRRFHTARARCVMAAHCFPIVFHPAAYRFTAV